MRDNESYDTTLGRISCPIEWCQGYRAEHGGDGTPPERWLHSGVDEHLSAGALGVFTQESAQPRIYGVELTVSGGYDADELQRLSGELAELSDELAARARILAVEHESTR